MNCRLKSQSAEYPGTRQKLRKVDTLAFAAIGLKTPECQKPVRSYGVHIIVEPPDLHSVAIARDHFDLNPQTLMAIDACDYRMHNDQSQNCIPGSRHYIKPW